MVKGYLVVEHVLCGSQLLYSASVVTLFCRISGLGNVWLNHAELFLLASQTEIPSDSDTTYIYWCVVKKLPEKFKSTPHYIYKVK